MPPSGAAGPVPGKKVWQSANFAASKPAVHKGSPTQAHTIELDFGAGHSMLTSSLKIGLAGPGSQCQRRRRVEGGRNVHEPSDSS